MGQLEMTVKDVSNRLEELTFSTRDAISQLRHELGLVKVKTRFSRALSSSVPTASTGGSGAGPSSTSLDNSQSTIGVASEPVDPTRLAGLEAAGSDLRQNIQDLASVVGATERLLRAELAKQIEQLRSEIESDRSKVAQASAELVRVTCTTAEVRQRIQDAEGKMQDRALEISTVKLSLASLVKDIQASIRESEQRQRDGMSEEVARSLEGFERSWSQHLRQQLERHQDEQVSRMDFLQQLQEEASGSGRTDSAAAKSQLDRVDAALQDLAAEHAARHEALAVQVQQLEGSCLASRADFDRASGELKEFQGELRLLSERALTHRYRPDEADDNNGATAEGLEAVSAKVAALQASFAAVNNDVSKLAQDLIESRTEHLVAVSKVSSCAERCAQRCAQRAVQRGSAASGEAAETRVQELATKIHEVQATTAGDLRALTQDLASMRSEYDEAISKLGRITEVVAQAAAASIQRTEARLATELDSKREELAKFVGAQQEEMRLKASSLMGTVLAKTPLPEKEGPEPSGASIPGRGAAAGTQIHSESLTAGSIFGADAKAVISMLRQCLGQVDALRAQVGDLQPRVSLLERGGTTDNVKPTQNASLNALSKAASKLASAQVWSSPSPQTRHAGSLDSPKPSKGLSYLTRAGSSDGIGLSAASGAFGDVKASTSPGTDLGRCRLSWAESHPLQGPFPERETSGEAVLSMQQPVPTDPGAERRFNPADDGSRSVPGRTAAAASIRQLHQTSPTALRPRESPIVSCSAALPVPDRQHSLTRTSPSRLRRGGVSPTRSTTSATSAQPTPPGHQFFLSAGGIPGAATPAAPPSRPKVTWPPSSAGHGTGILSGNIASGVAERQPIRVVGVD